MNSDIEEKDGWEDDFHDLDNDNDIFNIERKSIEDQEDKREKINLNKFKTKCLKIVLLIEFDRIRLDFV